MHAAFRFGLVYAGIYLGLGVTLPFLPVFLASRGLDPGGVALLLGIGQVARFAGGPLGASIADSLGSRRRALLVCGLGAVAGALAHLPADGIGPLALASLVFGLAAGPMSPITDAMALHAAAASGFQFGRVRAVGSFAFLVGTFASGLALAFGGPETVPQLAALASALVVPAALALPRAEVAAASGRSWAGAGAVLRSPGFGLLLLGSGLIQGSHAGYYAFSTLYWRSEGMSETWIAGLWSVGVAAEIVLLVFARAPVARLGPLRLALLAAAAGVVRWSLTAFVTDPVWLVLLQLLHALTFGALMLGALLWIASRIPAERGATAQALHAGLGQGMGTFLLTLLAGPLYARWGGAMFLAMAAASGIGAWVLWSLRRRSSRSRPDGILWSGEDARKNKGLESLQ